MSSAQVITPCSNLLQNVKGFSTNWNKTLTETLTNFSYIVIVYNLYPRDATCGKPVKRVVFKVRNQHFKHINGKRKNYASEKDWIMYVTSDKGLLSVAADCCRKERWRNLCQSPKAKCLSSHLFIDRPPTDRSTVICIEISVSIKIVLF